MPLSKSLLLLLLVPAALQGQQTIATTQFWNTNLHFNPATAGLEYRHAANVLYRNQWDRVNGAPNSILGNYAARIKRLHGAAGVSYRYDVMGFNRQHVALGHYAFHLPIGEEHILSLGVSGGAVIQDVSPAWNPPVTTTDPLLPASSKSTDFVLNAGLAWHTRNLNAGVSVTQLNAPAAGPYSYARHYWLFADYNFYINEHLALRPRMQAVTDAVKYSVTLSVMAIIYENGWVGVNCRTKDSFGFMGGYDFKGRYRIGYSYDWTTNQLSSVSRGTHEVVLAYLLK